LPDFITIVLANILVVTSYNLGYLGYCRFFNREANWWLIIIPIVITLVVFILYMDNFTVRVITLGFVSSIQYSVQFGLLVTTNATGVRRSKPILLASYGMIIVLFIIRAIYMIIHPDGIKNLFDPMWINSATLFATILSVILIASGVLLMLSERLLEENRELATRDSLTHIFNRRTFYDLARRELARAQRDNHETSLLILDIDRFKVINDTYGHLIGDEALIHLVDIIKDTVRVQDLYARYGGEEFVILLAETTGSEAYSISERLREKIADHSLQTHNHTIKMTVSIGLVTAPGIDKPTIESLINKADIAMYQAKRDGRNCTRVKDAIPVKEDILLSS
jgi:diguanylate cyclase (GGDEF)-like protein